MFIFVLFLLIVIFIYMWDNFWGGGIERWGFWWDFGMDSVNCYIGIY